MEAKTKAEKRKEITDWVYNYRVAGATFSEIAEFLNTHPNTKTMEGGKWTTQNLFNFYKRHKQKSP